RTTIKGNQVRVTSPEGRELILMTCVGSNQSVMVPVPARIEQGWVSRGYAHREPADVAVVEIDGRGQQRFTTIIVPVSEANGVEQFLERWLLCECGARAEAPRTERVSCTSSKH